MKPVEPSGNVGRDEGLVHGTVRDALQRPLAGATVRVFSRSMRAEQQLGKPAQTRADGSFEIVYPREEGAGAPDLFVRAQGPRDVHGESPIHYNAADRLRVDLDLSGRAWTGPSESERSFEAVRPLIGKVALAELEAKDLEFLSAKSGLDRANVEALALAARLEKRTRVPAVAWYGLLRSQSADSALLGAAPGAGTLEARTEQAGAALLRRGPERLAAALQASIDANVVPAAVAAELPEIRAGLEKLAPRADPQADALRLKLRIAGLEGDQVAAFRGVFTEAAGQNPALWAALAKDPRFEEQKTVLAQAVSTLSRLTGEQHVLTDELIKAEKIREPADLARLAGRSAGEWEQALQQHRIQPPGQGGTAAYAAQLEQAFAGAFPGHAFAARLRADKESPVPGAAAISWFLERNAGFDPLTGRAGALVEKTGLAAPERQRLALHLKRTQRVLRLSPGYASASVLLADGVDSAHKIYAIGEGNFVARYSAKLGAAEASQVFAKARKTHALALAMLGNLKSMAEASSLEVFPQYAAMITGALSAEVPDLDTLFGHGGTCECEECRSVYGAPAYLADLLHWLDNRVTSIACAPGEHASVEELLLRRRPDLGDLDLECNNSNVEIPYIDIANELMEDLVSAPAVTLPAAMLARLIPGPIDAALLAAIGAAFQAAGHTNLPPLLTAAATVSPKYSAERLRDDDTCVTEEHYILRDRYGVFKATALAAGVRVRLLHQTLLESDQIKANPEFTNLKAYESLRAAKRPFSLPFDLFEREGELYLEKLGTAKPALIEAFRPEHDALPHPTAGELDLAYASLGVTQAERALIFQQDLGGQAAYWGALAGGATARLDLFMNATGLTYDEVLRLLGLTTINPAKDSLIQSDDLTCDTSKKRVTALTPAKFDVIHRFLRLWKKTPLSLEELDAVVQAPALGNGNIRPRLAFQLQPFLKLMQLWSLQAFPLLVFFQDFGANGPGHLYDEVFQNRAVTNPLNPDFALAQVLAGPAIAITSVHRGVLAAALGLPAEDLGLLIAGSDGMLTPANLSRFYRLAQLAQALSVGTSELLPMLDLLAVSPFTDPATTAAFQSRVRTLVSSRLSTAELDAVLRHRNDPTGSLIASDDVATAALADLQDKLLRALAAAAPAPDPKGDLLKKWIADPLLGWNARIADKLLDILGTQDDAEYQQKVDNNHAFLLNLRIRSAAQPVTADLAALPAGLHIPDSIPGSLAAQLSWDPAAKKLILVGAMSDADRLALRGLDPDAAYRGAVQALFDNQTPSSAAGNLIFAADANIDANLRPLLRAQMPNRFALFLTAMAPAYRALLLNDALVRELSAWFGINRDVVEAFQASRPAIRTDLTDAAFVGKANPLTQANYPAQFAWYRRMAKVSFVTAKLKLAAADLAWIFANAATAGALDLWALPIAPVAGPVATFGAFERLIRILAFGQRYPARQWVTPASTTDVSVYTVLAHAAAAGANPVAIRQELAGLTGWDAAQLDDLSGGAANLLNLVVPADLADIRILQRLSRCFDVMRDLGATAALCASWAAPALAYEDAAKIKQALKARSGDAQWLQVTQPLQDKLREARRDALIAWLVTNPPAGKAWRSADDLYDDLLIDVQMCSCQPTSRIVQATNSAQQLVQRIFLNLEPAVTVDPVLDAAWTQWQWLKNFRVWQANRKVFLYPENWIEPELLPAAIKSPFLKELENELLQTDVTRENAETAFHGYLEKLDAVSRLEIKASWYDDARKTLHVVGRTYGGDPRLYYYRTLVENRRWTPWVRIDQDVAGDHVVLTVFNHRVYLFWGVFSEKSLEVDTVKVPNAGDSSFKPDKVPKYWQIQIAFSEYKHGKWTPKKVSSQDATGSLYVSQYWSDSDGAYLPQKPDFVFTALDLPELDFTHYFDENGEPVGTGTFLSTVLKDLLAALESNGDLRINVYLQYGDTPTYYSYRGTFDLDPCKGYPVVQNRYQGLRLTLFDRSKLVNMLDAEQSDPPVDSLALGGAAIVQRTPGRFANLLPMQMGFIDRLLELLYLLLWGLARKGKGGGNDERYPVSLGTFMPFFYQDKAYTYFVRPEFSDDAGFEFTNQDLEDLILAILEQNQKRVEEILATIPRGKPIRLMDRFFNFYHPLVCTFMRTLFDQGLDALMSRDTQLKGDPFFGPTPPAFSFLQTFKPTAAVYSGAPVTYNLPAGPVTDPHPGYPHADVDFDPAGGYSLYNWELFFHAPLMIAKRLSQNRQFEEADRWFKMIFNPTDVSAWPSPDRFWVTKPFFINVNDKYVQQNIDNILLGVDAGSKQLVDDVADWENNPFQPHYIAQYRTVAYQKATVMHYLDHVIAWADDLYRQHTMESVAEATQLYVLASQILGPKPVLIPSAFELPVDNYAQLRQRMDAFSNALEDIENLLPLQEITGYTGITPPQGLPNLQTLYFCIPGNEKLGKYWDTVGSRLFNIRHCLDIEGRFAPLSLFAPPIDPALLVRAAAAGLDLGSVLGDLGAPLPAYRFSSTCQRAVELCNEVKQLGASLLAALEKKDAEDLALLRSTNSLAVQAAALKVRELQVKEAEHALASLQQQRAMVQVRADYYQKLIQSGLNPWEIASLALSQSAIAGESAAVIVEYLGNVLALIPDFNLGASGFGGTPHVAAKFGGQQLGEAMRAMAGAIRGTAGVMHSQASVSSTQATFERRKEEWQHQLDLAKAELSQLDLQLLASTVRESIANQEVENQKLQIANAESEDAFMHGKFTSTELYSWMSGEVSTIYFQSYQLAYGLAKQAEQTFRYELALSDSSLVQFGHWDSLRKGLLAGDRLMLDLRNLEQAYRDQNARELELTRHISLAQLDPSALQLLKTQRDCWINLPEELFDMDYPGHYMRRIRTVGVSIPCVAGPYTPVSCVLTMTRNSMRVSNAAGDPAKYPRKKVAGVPADDPRFRDAIGSIQSIALSSGQNDDGLFEANLHDERFLKFEGAGLISQWHVELPAPFPQFDYSTLSDVILHVKYTARDGGQQLRSDAATSLATRINSMLVSLKDTGLMRVLSARHDFATEWYSFLHPASAAVDQVLTVPIPSERFPYFASVATIKITSIELVADSSVDPLGPITLSPAPSNAAPLNLAGDGYYGAMPRLVATYPVKKAPQTWTLTNAKANPRITADQIKDLLFIVHYEVS